jgi:hypothetical protein
MLLYHFTQLYNLENVGPENILAIGLKPSVGQREYAFLGLEPCVVWLTSDPLPPKPMTNLWHGGEIRITVVIPSTDGKLVRFEKYLRQQGVRIDPSQLEAYEGVTPSQLERSVKSCYVYFGEIPSSRIRKVERSPHHAV